MINDTDYAKTPALDVIDNKNIQVDIIKPNNDEIPVIWKKNHVESLDQPGIFEISIPIWHNFTKQSIGLNDKIAVSYIDQAGNDGNPVTITVNAGFKLTPGTLSIYDDIDEYAHGEELYLTLVDGDLNLDSKSKDIHKIPLYFIKAGNPLEHYSTFPNSGEGVLFKHVPDIHIVEFIETGPNTGIFESTYPMPKLLENKTLEHKVKIEIEYLDYGSSGESKDVKHMPFDDICCYGKEGGDRTRQIESNGQYCSKWYKLENGWCVLNTTPETHEKLDKLAKTKNINYNEISKVLRITDTEIKINDSKYDGIKLVKHDYHALFEYRDHGVLEVEYIVEITGENYNKSFKIKTTFSKERDYPQKVPGEHLKSGSYDVSMFGRFMFDNKQFETEPAFHKLTVK